MSFSRAGRRAGRERRHKGRLPRERSFEEMTRGSAIRSTRQRRTLLGLLFSGGEKHVTAESLHQEAGGAVSLATVYNTLNLLTKEGLLKQVAVSGGRQYFDTNLEPHHHFYDEETGAIMDFPEHGVIIDGLPPTPKGRKVARLDLVVRLSRS